LEYNSFEVNLIDKYDEETVLLQIPQNDTRVEDVVKKFKNQNKVKDTIVALKDKGRIIDGQGYMRRLVDSEAVKNTDVPRSGVNRWVCGDCGKKFHSQEPYRNRDDHAICDECNEKSGSSYS
jgi:DNA-directed RNA polymerase subunit RPC12/RpoP